VRLRNALVARSRNTRSVALALALVSSSVLAGPSIGKDPASLKLKIFGVYASTSPQCTNPVNVFLKSAPEYVDLLQGPDLGGGDLADGTYNCVIIKMSDVIKHTPKETDSSCVAGTEYSGEVCRAGGDEATGLDGSPIACTGDGSSAGVGEDTVFMFMTTDPGASAGNRAFELPLAPGDGKGIRLGSPLVISSTTKAKFVVDASGGVVAGGGECGINPPTFRFEKL
jgi:hypothetical protein